MSDLGPIAELRLAKEAKAALALGGLIGGAAPLMNYFTVHLGDLARFDGELYEFHYRWSPLWFLVAGSFLLSSKSVYRWGKNTFGDRGSALGLVAMLEMGLVLAPHWTIGYAALGFLVFLNAAAYGSALARRDRQDRAREAAEAVAAAAPPARARASSPAPAATPSVALVARPPEPQPRAVPALPAPRWEEDALYTRAVEVARKNTSLSTEVLRRELGTRQPTAAALIARLEREGVIGQPDPSDRGRRPVLMRAESA